MPRKELELDLLNSFWQRAEREDMFRPYLWAIKRARSFTLDSEATEIVANMAFSGDIALDKKFQKKVNDYRQLARLPYPVVWLEVSGTVLDTLLASWGHKNRRSMFDVPERLGFLMDRNPSDETSFRITTLGLMVDPVSRERGQTTPRASLFPCTQNVTTAPEGKLWQSHPSMPARLRETTNRANAEGIMSAICWGTLPIDETGSFNGLKSIVRNTPLHMTSSVELDLQWYKFMEATGKTDNMDQVITNALTDQRFDLRFIVAALALLNHVPVRYVPYRPSGSMRCRAGIKPFMGTSVITVEIPATRRRMKLIEGHIKSRTEGWRNRRHEVKGHWRVSDKQVTDKWERFFDPIQERPRWRLWIEEHERGDASLGYVEQYHKVTAAQTGRDAYASQ